MHEFPHLSHSAMNTQWVWYSVYKCEAANLQISVNYVTRVNELHSTEQLTHYLPKAQKHASIVLNKISSIQD